MKHTGHTQSPDPNSPGGERTNSRTPAPLIEPTHPGDVSPQALRAAMHQVADMVCDYLENVRSYPVLPRIAPGQIRQAMPPAPPEQPEPLEQILADYHRLIEPNITHWNNPGFMAYFPVTGSGPGILGETLAAALDVNGFWNGSTASMMRPAGE